MPSITHEAPIELIRQHPELAVDLLRAVTDISLPGAATVALSATDMSDVIPKQYLADLVVVISDAATGEAALSVIIESQLREDETKQYSWPVYVASARRLRGCPAAVLLVICPDPVEAGKCAQVIRTGHPGFDLAPIVISPQNAPGAGDAAPWLTVFAACMGAIDLEDKTNASHVLSAINQTRAGIADRRRMTAIILNLASEAARAILEETTMALPDVQNDFLDRIEAAAAAKAAAKAAAEATAKATAETTAKVKAEDVLRILAARHLEPTEAQRKLVTGCTDLGQLDRWFDRALTAPAIDQVFTADD
jgi:hypothetical protein